MFSHPNLTCKGEGFCPQQLQTVQYECRSYGNAHTTLYAAFTDLRMTRNGQNDERSRHITVRGVLHLGGTELRARQA